MKPVVLTAGVVMREYDGSDAAALLTAVDASRQRLARWMPWVPFATTVQDFEDFIRVATRQGRDGSGQHLGLFDDHRVVGAVGASIGSLNFDEADVGYWLAESHEGLGLVSAPSPTSSSGCLPNATCTGSRSELRSKTGAAGPWPNALDSPSKEFFGDRCCSTASTPMRRCIRCSSPNGKPATEY